MSLRQLETDEEVLISKCKKSLEAYGMHIVVGNLLESRYDRVMLVSASRSTKLRRQDSAPIERALVQELVRCHTDFACGTDWSVGNLDEHT